MIFMKDCSIKGRRNKYSLDPYYSRHDQGNTWRKRGSNKTAIIIALCSIIGILIAHLCTSPDINPGLPKHSEKLNMRDHLLATVTADEMRLYEYYTNRSR